MVIDNGNCCLRDLLGHKVNLDSHDILNLVRGFPIPQNLLIILDNIGQERVILSQPWLFSFLARIESLHGTDTNSRIWQGNDQALGQSYRYNAIMPASVPKVLSSRTTVFPKGDFNLKKLRPHVVKASRVLDQTLKAIRKALCRAYWFQDVIRDRIFELQFMPVANQSTLEYFTFICNLAVCHRLRNYKSGEIRENLRHLDAGRHECTMAEIEAREPHLHNKNGIVNLVRAEVLQYGMLSILSKDHAKTREMHIVITHLPTCGEHSTEIEYLSLFVQLKLNMASIDEPVKLFKDFLGSFILLIKFVISAAYKLVLMSSFPLMGKCNDLVETKRPDPLQDKLSMTPKDLNQKDETALAALCLPTAKLETSESPIDVPMKPLKDCTHDTTSMSIPHTEQLLRNFEDLMSICPRFRNGCDEICEVLTFDPNCAQQLGLFEDFN
ncbi:hypothetical protein BS47DRAFT_1365938 [Hydnum rufescens UP504]|uniref:Uncharacterized protein n=1 Tax=Hydnum rufescens UP504 TaxID=1448309 RepID=A0A9P6AME0_9AGAM|nr:hypothetical protein BS47DRAFT_1365938 [Hydnum rufescens UP504]